MLFRSRVMNQHQQRDTLQQSLADAGVGTLIHYPIPPHRQQAYASAGHREGEFPLAEKLADKVLSLPIGPHLTMEEAKEVVHQVCALQQ